MKYFIDGIVVVEGTGDSSYLSSFIDALFIETNGFDIKKEDLDFLIHSNKKIIVLTDSDEAGEIIRNKLNNYVPGIINAKVNKELCNKNGKHGVAECQKGEIINVLKEHFTNRIAALEKIYLKDLIGITNNDQEIKEFISNKFHIGSLNNKEMLKRINFLGISKDQIEREVKELYGNQ